MKELIEVAQSHPHPERGPIPVIGDAARACGGGYRGGKIGKEGLLNVFSFHTMKNMSTLGEGGMIATDDPEVADFCRSTRFYGIDTEVWGTSNVMTTVQAAVGLVQLSKLDGLIAARRKLAAQRNELLADVPELVLPLEPADCEHSYYLYTLLVPQQWRGEKRERLMARMEQEFGIGCVVANRPVYQVRKLLREATPGQSLPLSEELGERLLCVSIHPTMSEDLNEYICAALIECVRDLRG
jgi:perosamine synthetase